MSIFEMFKKKNQDERLVAQMNEVYRIGYMILSFGYLVVLFYQISCMQVTTAFVGEASLTDFIDPVYFTVFMIAQIACAIIAAKRGIGDSSRYANTETFPIAYYMTMWIGVGLAATIGIALMRMAAEWQIIGLDSVHWLGDAAVGAFFGISIFVVGIVLQVIVYKSTKKQTDKQINKLDD